MPNDPSVSLPVIPFARASDICAKFDLSAPAKALLKPEHTPGEYFHLLEQRRLAHDAVKLLAYGLPERDAVDWACRCARLVLLKLNSSDKLALAAAEAWVKNPNADSAATAGSMASNTSLRGPGGWAAQAAGASASGSPASPPSPAPSNSAGGGVLPKSVAGSVLLAAGLTKLPPMAELPKVDLKLPKITVTTPSPGAFPQVVLPAIDQAALAAMLLAYPKLSDQLSPALRTAFFASLALIQVPSPALLAALAQVGLPALGGWSGGSVAWLKAVFPNVGLPALPSLPTTPVLPSVAGSVPNLALPVAPGLPNAPGMPGLPTMPDLKMPELKGLENLPGFLPLLSGLPATALPSILAALGKIQIPSVDPAKLASILAPFIAIGKDVAMGKPQSGKGT